MEKQCMLEIQTALKDKGSTGWLFYGFRPEANGGDTDLEMSSDPKF